MLRFKAAGGVRRRLLTSAAARALTIAPAALAFGVSLTGEASAGTVNPVQSTTYSLSPSNNPITFGTGTSILTPVAMDAVLGDPSTSWNVTNQGTLLGQSGVVLFSSSDLTNDGNIVGALGPGVVLEAGGTLTNQAAGHIQGYTVGASFGGATTITNAGTITESSLIVGYGVLSRSSGAVTLTNESGGAIKGNTDGVYLLSGSVTNDGAITGVIGRGVLLGQGGSVATGIGSSIAGGSDGVGIYGGAGQVSNSGSITGQFAGVALNSGGSVSNTSTGTISAHNYGLYAKGASATVTNSGLIASTAGTAVELKAGGSVANQAGGTISGDVAGYGVLAANSAADVTNAGTITGGKGVYLRAGGSVTNQVTGLISGGSAAVEVKLDGSVNNAGQITGPIDGIRLVGGGTVDNLSGGAISAGNGIVVLGGNANITNAGAIGGGNYGVALISGATGAVTNAGSITATHSDGVLLGAGGSLINQAGGQISGGKYGVALAGGGTVTNAGVVSGGADAIVFTGAGANTLTLQTGSALTGAVVGSSTAGATNALVLQGGGAAGNTFSNFNSLTMQGPGTWALGGSFGVGTTNVTGGVLVLNGAFVSAATTVTAGDLEVGDAAHASAALTGPVTVNSGATLSGHGTVVGNVTSGGVTAPGGTVGVLTINGNFSQSAGGTLAIEVAPHGGSELVVTGAANLAGALQVNEDAGFYRKGQQFDLLSAGSISGVFGSTSVNGPVQFGFNTQGGLLVATAQNGNFALQGGAANQRAIAAAINNYPAGVSDFDPVAAALFALPGGATQNEAANRLASEAGPDLVSAGRDSVRSRLGALIQQLDDRTPGAGGGDPVWIGGVGRFGHASSDGNANGFTSSDGGVAGGVHRDFGASTLGAAISYDVASLDLGGLAQTGRTADTAGALYGEQRFGTAFLDASGAWGFVHSSTHRNIVFAGVGRAASASFDGSEGGFTALAGERMAMSGGWTLEPRAGVAWSEVRENGYAETGAGGADLTVAPARQDAVQSLLGVRLFRALSGGGLSAEGSLDWTHDFDDLTPRAAESFTAAPGTGFTIAGVNPGRDAALLRAGIGYRVARVSFFARYEGSFSQKATLNAVTGGLSVHF